MQFKKITGAAGFVFAIAVTPALATNGYFLHGYGGQSCWFDAGG